MKKSAPRRAKPKRRPKPSARYFRIFLSLIRTADFLKGFKRVR